MSAIWKKIELGEIIDLKYGKGLSKNQRVEGEFPVYGSGGIIDFHNEPLLKGPTIIVGRKGSIGTVFYEEKNCFPIDTVFYVELRNVNTHLKFIYPLLKNLNLSRLGSDAAVPGLNRHAALKQEVNLPDQKTQQKIASVLSTYDNLIENNTRRIAILEEMAQRIYKEWFVDFKYPGHENDELVDSELGMIPEGWEVKSLDTLGSIITGKTPSKKKNHFYGKDVPFIKTPDMHGNIFCTSTKEYLSNVGAESQNNKTLPKDSLLVSCIGTAGIVSITAFKSQTNQQINAIVPWKGILREFLYFSLRDLKDTINLYGATGATMVNLNKSKFEGLKISYPKNELISIYCNVVKPIFNNIKLIQLKNHNLCQTRDHLLPKLISGQVDVSDLNIDTGADA